MGVHYGCLIDAIRWGEGIPVLAFEVVKGNGERQLIQVQNRDARQRISGLLAGETEHVFLAFWLEDVDIWRSGNGKYYIEWSPTEYVDEVYEVDAEALGRLVQEE